MAMKKIKSAEAPSQALDWLVAKARGEAVSMETWWFDHKNYSTDWAQGGPIIDRESIFLSPGSENMWPSARTRTTDGRDTGWISGETMLIAAMRCFVASKLGDEVEVPEELT